MKPKKVQPIWRQRCSPFAGVAELHSYLELLRARHIPHRLVERHDKNGKLLYTSVEEAHVRVHVGDKTENVKPLTTHPIDNHQEYRLCELAMNGDLIPINQSAGETAGYVHKKWIEPAKGDDDFEEMERPKPETKTAPNE